MKGKRIVGLIIAGVVLIAVICFMIFGDEKSAPWSLPVLSVGMWAMAIADTVAYRAEPYQGLQKKSEFVRIVGGYVFAVILTVLTVIFLVKG